MSNCVWVTFDGGFSGRSVNCNAFAGIVGVGELYPGVAII